MVLEYLLRLFLSYYRILLAADEGYDGAFVSLAPIHANRVFQIHVHCCPISLRGHFNQLCKSALGGSPDVLFLTERDTAQFRL